MCAHGFMPNVDRAKRLLHSELEQQVNWKKCGILTDKNLILKV